jgi:hypothetical protein
MPKTRKRKVQRQRDVKKTRTRGGNFKKPPYVNSIPINTYVSLIPTSTTVESEFISYIKSLYNKKPSTLGVGTPIYRTALEKNPMEFFSSKKDFVFFGLDAWIAIWYALELWQRYKTDRHSLSYNDWFVYLHEYRVIKPIRYKYLEDLHTNPKDEPYYEICKLQPCVHPQQILHGNFGIVKEYGTEVTIPYNFAMKDYLKPVKSYRVNLIKLLEMQDTLSEWVGSSLEDAVSPIKI